MKQALTAEEFLAQHNLDPETGLRKSKRQEERNRFNRENVTLIGLTVERPGAYLNRFDCDPIAVPAVA